MKTKTVIFATFLLIAAGSFASCQKEQKERITPVTIGKGVLPNGGIESLAKQNITITTKAAWDNLMATMNANGNVSADFSETEIDFNTWQVIAVFDEIHANGEWTIDITEVTGYADKIVVSYTNLATGNANLVPTQPYHIVKIPASTKHITFEAEDGLYLYAEVENASKYSNIVEVKLMMCDDNGKQIELASGEWKSDGFTMALPKTVNPKYFHPLINNNWLPIITNMPPTMSISNRNVKVGDANFWGVDRDGNVVTHFFPLEVDKDGNINDAFCVYVNSDVTISGYTEREGTFTFTKHDKERFSGIDLVLPWLKITTIYSIMSKKGWNVWCLSRFYYLEQGRSTEKWTTTPAGNLKWYGGEDLRGLNIN